MRKPRRRTNCGRRDRKNEPTELAGWMNLKRADNANEIGRSLLSKRHLPKWVDEFLPNAAPGPDDSFVPPAWLTTQQATEEEAASEVQTPLTPPTCFDLSDDSAKFNSELLKECNPDL